MKRKYNCKEINESCILTFLSSIDVLPHKSSGNNHYFFSPIRSEKNPSFHVNSVINRWYDPGIGDGGKLVDLGILIYKCDVKGFIEIFNKNNFSFHKPKIRIEEKTSKVIIKKVLPITNRALLKYSRSRNISDSITKRYLKEVHFENGNNNYYALGFENIKNGFELRNQFFKGSSAPKDITLITNGCKDVAVWEGAFNMLSFIELKGHQEVPCDYLVLNGQQNIKKALPHLANYRRVYLFLDNDKEDGASGVESFLELRPKQTIDFSTVYKGHNDLNEAANTPGLNSEIFLQHIRRIFFEHVNRIEAENKRSRYNRKSFGMNM